MMKHQHALLLLGFAFALQGCNTMSKQPDLTNAQINPDTLIPGDSAVITVEVKDKNSIIDRIEGVVKEDPRITFPLHDDGQDPDTKAGDGVWSLKVDVPAQAPDGSFTLEFTAYRSDGTAVPVRDKQGNVSSLTESIPVVIQYQRGPATDQAPVEEAPTEDAPADEPEEVAPAAEDASVEVDGAVDAAAEDEQGDDQVVDSTPSDPTRP